MFRKSLLLLAALLLIAAPFASSQAPLPFNTSTLVNPGDTAHFGSYQVIKIATGIYQISDPGDPKAKMAGLIGTDIYVINGAAKALIIDLGNNYIDGYKADEIPPRPNAALELRTVITGLIGKLPFEVAITHAHPDHTGMTKAFLDGKPTIWMPKGEDLAAPKTQHGIDPAVFTVFDQQTKTWDLGGGRVITPLLVRGHTNGCTAYTLRSESIIFTGDCLGLGRGILLRNAAGLKDWASDTDKLVSYIKANFTPYQRFALKVFTGHSSASPIEGYLGPDHGPLDLAWLDWRFLQDQALCGNAMLKGLWLSNESGLRLIQVTDPNTGAKTGTFLFGIGAVEMPVPEAYKAAGIKMTE